MQGLAEEEVRDDGHRGRRVGVEPPEKRNMELVQGGNDGYVSSVADVPDVFDARMCVLILQEVEKPNRKGIYPNFSTTVVLEPI